MVDLRIPKLIFVSVHLAVDIDRHSVSNSDTLRRGNPPASETERVSKMTNTIGLYIVDQTANFYNGRTVKVIGETSTTGRIVRVVGTNIQFVTDLRYLMHKPD